MMIDVLAESGLSECTPEACPGLDGLFWFMIGIPAVFVILMIAIWLVAFVIGTRAPEQRRRDVTTDENGPSEP